MRDYLIDRGGGVANVPEVSESISWIGIICVYIFSKHKLVNLTFCLGKVDQLSDSNLILPVYSECSFVTPVYILFAVYRLEQIIYKVVDRWGGEISSRQENGSLNCRQVQASFLRMSLSTRMNTICLLPFSSRNWNDVKYELGLLHTAFPLPPHKKEIKKRMGKTVRFPSWSETKKVSPHSKF